MSKEKKIIWECADCGSSDVLAQGTMIWVYAKQDWLSNERESHFCEDCSSDNVGPVEVEDDDARLRRLVQRIRI